MFKSYISLDVRVLLLSGDKTFLPCGAGAPVLNPLAARKAYLLIRGLEGNVLREAFYERITGVPVPKGGPVLTGLSIKLGDGVMDINFHRRRKRIRIDEIRVEEDAGRLVHAAGRRAMMDYTWAGMPSLRIRTAADFEIGEEAEIFLSELRRRIQYLELVSPESGISGTTVPGNRVSLESLIRCNAYAAIAPYPEPPAVFVKLRNLNSFNFVHKALDYELLRQEEILAGGGTVAAESRLWNEAKQASESFRPRAGPEKRRFEPAAMPPYRAGPEILEALDNFTLEPPEARRDRFMNDFGLTQLQAELICDEKGRADFFEDVLARGANPREAARWMTYVCKEWKRLGLGPRETPLTAERFARIIRDLHARRIHGSIARQTISAVLEEDRDPADIARERGWERLADRKAIEALIHRIVDGNPQEVRRIREGDPGPLQFLTGLVMKETGGLADPALVKEILRETLSVSLVYVLSMGGAISGRIGEDGAVESGDEQVLRDLLAGGAITARADASRVRFEAVQAGRTFSEEIVPSDWAALIETVAARLNSGTANGIVVAHGTDTLPYTAPLLYWLFADAGVPVVLAAASSPPGASPEAKAVMKKAVDLALKKTRGVYVVHGGKILSPLNLKFERIGVEGFRNWNMETPVFSGGSLLTGLTGPLEADRYVLSRLLEDAVNSMCVIRTYPGIRSDYLGALMEKGVKNFFLELYDTGTAGFREGPYSLRRAFNTGKRRGVRFYCSSQQEGIVDFSGYAGSRELWREGAIPMGPCTTETAVARFLAASIVADSEKERAELMEKSVLSP